MSLAEHNPYSITFNEETWYLRDSAHKLVMGTHSSSTHNWTGDLPPGYESYTSPENLIIDYYLPFDSDEQPVTLKLGTLDAKPVYVCHGTEQVTKEFGAKTVIRLAYVVDNGLNHGNGAWKVVGTDVSKQQAQGGLDISYDYASKINSWTDGAVPSLTKDSKTCSRINNFDKGTLSTMSISKGLLKFTTGTLATLDKQDYTFDAVGSFSQGSMPSLSYTEDPIKLVKDVAMIED